MSFFRFRLMDPRISILFVGITLHWVLSASGYERLTEKTLNLPGANLGAGVKIPPVSPRRIAGYFKLDRTYNASMFYFLFDSRSHPAKDPLVLWMTGGPGCSSELAIFYENGPYALVNKTLTETANGWDVGHNMLFVDQPINTGFSYSDDERDRVYDEYVVADDMLDFLQVFFEAHPELADNDFYITGESYAGHYVPAVAHRVWEAAKKGEGRPIPLKGIAIGNGMTNPSIQFGAYADFALENKLIKQEVHDSIQVVYPICKALCDLCTRTELSVLCTLSYVFCEYTIFQSIMAAQPDMNVYDITKKCIGPLCYDFTDLEEYLARADVRQALGIPEGREWSMCNMQVNTDFNGDWARAYDQLLPALLADNIRVMIYAGDLDLICNWLGNKRWVDSLNWVGAEGWAGAPTLDWMLNGKNVGNVRQFGPLSFVKVYQAGHMVPMDQPEAGLDMITRFTRNTPLASSTSKLVLPSRKKAALSGRKGGHVAPQ